MLNHTHFSAFVAATSAPDLIGARLRTGLTRADVAALVNLSARQLRRQEHGDSAPSLCVYRLLLLLGGVIPWEPWHGWQFGPDGKLYAPEDQYRGYEPGDLRRAHWLSQMIRHHQAREPQQLALTLTGPSATGTAQRRYAADG